MIRYILDTNAVSDLSRQHPNAHLLNWLSVRDMATLAIPAVVVFEIQYGIEKQRLAGKTTRADELEAWLETVLGTEQLTVLPAGPEVARMQARLFAIPALRDFFTPHPGSTKMKVGVDLVIAAVALVHDAAIVTFNVRDYQRIHALHPLPGVMHAGTGEWAVPPQTRPFTPG
ncbi:PIN domain-containing protein [Niveispirillum sp. KHB5.9]|uniref:PIN domain-containing protein n=1 Tax=Niveispirillum sp. KHB5.9 TaxID=3400269 RepID=UPI003A88E0A0